MSSTDEWLDISSAPKDGKPVVVRHNTRSGFVYEWMFWSGMRQRWETGRGIPASTPVRQPTEWSRQGTNDTRTTNQQPGQR